MMSDEPEEESEYVMVDAAGNLVTEVHGEDAESDEDISEGASEGVSEEESEEEDEEESDEEGEGLSEEEDSDDVALEPTLEELEGEHSLTHALYHYTTTLTHSLTHHHAHMFLLSLFWSNCADDCVGVRVPCRRVQGPAEHCGDSGGEARHRYHGRQGEPPDRVPDQGVSG